MITSLRIYASQKYHNHIDSKIFPHTKQENISGPDLCSNEKKYTYNHKYENAAEITLHFISIKELKFAYRQNGNKLARALVAYL